MYIFQSYLKLERISDCLCWEGGGGELDPTLALNLLWRLPMSQMTQEGCSCLFFCLESVLPWVGREALRAPYYSPHHVHTQHTHPPALLCSHRQLCPHGPRGREPGSQHTRSGSRLRSTQEPQALHLFPAPDQQSPKTTAGLHRKGPRSTCFSWIKRCFP